MAPAAKHVQKKAAPKFRASWRGNVSFGLVSFPVHAVNAFNSQGSDYHFHQIHARCHRRIEHRKVCPVHGEVSNEEIVSGYEIKKGRYVEIEPEELDALRTEKERSLAIDAFVAPDEIDPVYYDGRMYYLAPDNASAMEPYVVLAEAMEQAGKYGVGQVVFSGKEQIALLRVIDGVLHLAMLNYEPEIRSPREVVVLKQPTGKAAKVKLAQTLIKHWSPRDFDFSDYEDTYRQKVKELIAAKSRGKVIQPPPEPEEGEEIVSFMDALKKSLHQVGHASGRKSKRRRAS